MNKTSFQNEKYIISFETKNAGCFFQEYPGILDFLPADELMMVERLRELVYQAIPDCSEKLAYNVPYFKRHANICFIWPASVPWGKVSQQGVRLGLTKGFLLQDEIKYLDKGTRKEVYYKDFMTSDDINETIVLTYLTRAADVDEEVYLLKKEKNKQPSKSPRP